jgi:hypothetical protein
MAHDNTGGNIKLYEYQALPLYHSTSFRVGPRRAIDLAGYESDGRPFGSSTLTFGPRLKLSKKPEVYYISFSAS